MNTSSYQRRGGATQPSLSASQLQQSGQKGTRYHHATRRVGGLVRSGLLLHNHNNNHANNARFLSVGTNKTGVHRSTSGSSCGGSSCGTQSTYLCSTTLGSSSSVSSASTSSCYFTNESAMSFSDYSVTSSTTNTKSISGSSSSSRRRLNRNNSGPKQDKFRDDPEKKKHIKIELCGTYPHIHLCKFGQSCNYAHSEKELKMTKLFERHEAGLVDIETFLTRPCPNFVATGDCPFGLRCSYIHDPRVGGTDKWWLPHCALKNSKIQTDVQVDWFSHVNFSSNHYGHPFGPLFRKKLTDMPFHIFADTICNTSTSTNAAAVAAPGRQVGMSLAVHTTQGTASFLSADQQDHCVWGKPVPSSVPIMTAAKRGSLSSSSCSSFSPLALSSLSLLSEAKRLSIALQMRHDYSELYKYKYQHSHIIFDELCMVVQTCVFDVGSKEGDSPKEIPLAAFDPKKPSHTIVREIAFGPPMSPTDRPLALFFDIHDSKVRQCTEQEMKRHRRTNRKLKKKKKEEDKISSSSAAMAANKPSAIHTTTATTNSYAQVAAQSGNSSSSDSLAILGRDLQSSFDEDYKNQISTHTINKPFMVVIPKDKDSYDLVTEVLQNRLQLRFPLTWNEKDIANEKITKQKLAQKFGSLVNHHQMFHLPVNAGREYVDKNTPVPKVNQKYNVSATATACPTTTSQPAHSSSSLPPYQQSSLSSSWHQSFKERVLESFVQMANAGFAQEEYCHHQHTEKDKRQQFDIFKSLPSTDRSVIHQHHDSHLVCLPHIIGKEKGRKEEAKSPPPAGGDYEDEQYWKAILLYSGSSTDPAAGNTNGWDVMKAYIKEKKLAEKERQAKMEQQPYCYESY